MNTLISSITPNIPWGIDVPNYFWFTGSSAAAFIISSFAHVFGMERYKPIAGFSLLMAFVLLVAAPLNLIDDLKQPGRIFNFFFYGWENFTTSPMKWGVILLLAYPVLIFFEALYIYRPYFVKKMAVANGFARSFYGFLTLGRSGVTQADLDKDHKVGKRLGTIGIPLALCVHGYTGYILGAVHANALWHTPLMPILFLASAMVSGTGFLIIVIPIFQKLFTSMGSVNHETMVDLAKLLALFIVIDLVIRFLWLTFAMPFNGEEKYLLYAFFELNFHEVLYVEYLLCLIVPMIVGFSALRENFMVLYIAGILSVVGVWLFRWNTVIGGQSIPKTSPGFLSYAPDIVGQSSIFSVLSNWGILMALICFILVIFPWDEEMVESYSKRVNHGK